IVRRQLEEHHGRPQHVTETGDAEDRETREHLAEMGDPDWDARVKEPFQPHQEEADGSWHGVVDASESNGGLKWTLDNRKGQPRPLADGRAARSCWPGPLVARVIWSS